MEFCPLALGTLEKNTRHRSRSLLLALAVLTASFGDASADDPNPVVTFESSLGKIQLELFAEQAPITVENFLAYVEADFFDGTICHRVIPSFMIQCGGFTVDMNKKATRPAIENEADNGLLNERGTIAMARSQAVNSATAQFFINLKDNAFLDHGSRDFGYAVFGKVVGGMDVVDQIAAVETASSKGHPNVPIEAVIFKAATLETAK